VDGTTTHRLQPANHPTFDDWQSSTRCQLLEQLKKSVRVYLGGTEKYLVSCADTIVNAEI